MGDNSLFCDMKAWFSQSVSEKRKHLWTHEGGTILQNPDKADFIFSEDAGHEDTRPFYKTRAFLTEELTIFHPSYIEQLIERSSTSTLRLDRFILPSLEMQKEMSNLGMTFAFEEVDKTQLRDTLYDKNQEYKKFKKYTYTSFVVPPRYAPAKLAVKRNAI